MSDTKKVYQYYTFRQYLKVLFLWIFVRVKLTKKVSDESLDQYDIHIVSHFRYASPATLLLVIILFFSCLWNSGLRDFFVEELPYIWDKDVSVYRVPFNNEFFALPKWKQTHLLFMWKYFNY